MSFYSNESIFQVLFVTLVLGGGCAVLAGRAIALTWRSIGIAVIAMIPLGMAVRFVHFALFNETLLQPQAYVVETVILIAASSVFSAYPGAADGPSVLLAVRTARSPRLAAAARCASQGMSAA